MSMEVRKRKTKSSSSTSPGPKKSSRRSKTSESVDIGFTITIVLTFVTLAGLVAALAFYPHHVPKPISKAVDAGLSALGLQKGVYAVVIDAGSTGSRVLAFTFHRGLLDGQLRLDDELWHEVKPGLSSYADDPKAAAASLEKLLDQARSRVPEDKRKDTPIILKATAGLRLLPGDKSTAILNEAEATLRASGFKPEERLIEIMDPTEEGVFGWFTVNFLTDNLIGRERIVNETYATLDLGGGSTQITFVPGRKPQQGLQGRKDFIHEINIVGETTQLYSHSYLGLGLMAARDAVFKSGNPAGATELKTPCLTSKDKLPFKYQGKEYTIVGQNPSVENCIKVVNKVVNGGNVHMPQGLSDKTVAAFSYFFDRASEIGMIPRGATQGSVKVNDFIYEAGRACDADANPNSGFYCVDLAFISSMLTKGYGLPQEKEITLYKKVNGHEASWALGLAYKTLQA